jgi:hypothetical protein
MDAEDKKYDKVLDLLKKSRPVFGNADVFSKKVIRLLHEQKSKVSLPELIIEYLFGWVYTGWIRRSMVAAALVMVVFFGFQQTLILKRINDLSLERIQNGVLFKASLTDDLTSRILEYRLTGKQFSDGKVTVSEEEIDNLIRSVNKLQIKYRDLIYLIENDPQLKKYIESRMNENRKN